MNEPALLEVVRWLNEARRVADRDAVEAALDVLAAMKELLAAHEPAEPPAERTAPQPGRREPTPETAPAPSAAAETAPAGGAAQSGFEELERAIRELPREGPARTAASAFLEPLLEQMAESLLAYPSHRLAVYGSLAPGAANHGVVAGIQGTWDAGTVRGRRAGPAPGGTGGYPALTWDPEGEPVPVQVLRSSELPRHWTRLDAFEGPAYRRILVPVEGLTDGTRVCNLYASREPAP